MRFYALVACHVQMRQGNSLFHKGKEFQNFKFNNFV